MTSLGSQTSKYVFAPHRQGLCTGLACAERAPKQRWRGSGKRHGVAHTLFVYRVGSRPQHPHVITAFSVPECTGIYTRFSALVPRSLPSFSPNYSPAGKRALFCRAPRRSPRRLSFSVFKKATTVPILTVRSVRAKISRVYPANTKTKTVHRTCVVGEAHEGAQPSRSNVRGDS